MQNTTRKELENRGFNFKLMYGDCPVYYRDGFGYMFKERGETLEQIMPSYVATLNAPKPIGYLRERMMRIDYGEEMGFNQLPKDFEELANICQMFAYAKTKETINQKVYK